MTSLSGQGERSSLDTGNEADFFRKLFESAPARLLVITAKEHIIVTASDAYLKATFTSRDQLAGRYLFDVFRDDPARPEASVGHKLQASLEAVETQGGADTLTLPHYPFPDQPPRESGIEENRWTVVNSPVLDDHGQVTHIIHRVEEVAGQPDADATLASAEKLRRIAGRIARLAGWSVDPNTGVSHWSDEIQQIYELEPGSRIDMRTLYTPRDRERLGRYYRDCRQQGQPFDDVFQLITPKGSHLWVRVIAEPEVDRNGSVTRIQGAVLDVTAQTLTEKALRERVKELRCLHQTALLLSNQQQSTPDLLKELVEVLPPAMLYHYRSVARIRYEDEEYRSGNWQDTAIAIRADIVHKDRKVGWIEAGYPLTHYPEPHHKLIFLDEETEMLQALALQIGQTLDNRDATRRLAQSQRMEAIGQLTGGIAHDFNNLLTVILGNTEMLTEVLEHHPEAARFINMIATAADRGAQLTNRLLAFARRQALEPRPVMIDRLMTDIEPLLRSTLTGNIAIDLCSTPNLWQADIDPVQLETALLNLTINARDAMPEGGRITIEAANASLDSAWVLQNEDIAAGDYVMIAVTDTGTGMAAEICSRAFEPFFTTKKDGKGSGLGLSMVYGFVKQSGGQAKIYSEPGEGTTVRLYLPRAQATGSPAEERARSTTQRHGHEHILVVEDDELVRNHVIGVLRSFGYHVSSATSGPEALARLREEGPVDLLFTDVIMPGGMNGPELAATARTLYPGLKVLYTSGYTENAIIHHGRLDPGVLLLSKPYRGEELASKIRNALERQ